MREWQEVRSDKGMLKNLAERRIAYFIALQKDENHTPPRNFRVFLSYSVKMDPSHPLQGKTIQGFENKSRKPWNETPTFVPGHGKTSHALRKDLCYTRDDQSPLKPSVQVCENQVVFDNETAIRTYSVESFPTYWALGAMGSLIGDAYNEYARLKISFTFIMVLDSCTRKRQEKFHKRMMIIDHQSKSPT